MRRKGSRDMRRFERIEIVVRNERGGGVNLRMGAHWIDIIRACGPRVFPRVVLDDAGAASRDGTTSSFFQRIIRNICFSSRLTG